MARDLRQLYSFEDYPDRCYYYDSTAVKDNKLVPDAKPLGRFNKRDLISFQWERVTLNGVLTNRRQFIGTIETLDHVEDLRPDMYVKDQTGMLFLVVPPVISDDENRSKVVGSRPAIVTSMVLRGVEYK